MVSPNTIADDAKLATKSAHRNHKHRQGNSYLSCSAALSARRQLMTAIRAVLDAKALGASRRTVARRKLRFAARGSADSGVTNVLILDISTTGLLLESDAALANGEAIELDLPEAAGIRAVVKWTSGDLFGCQFKKPISKAAVSAALLRAPYAASAPDLAHSAVSDLAGQADDDIGRQLLAFKLRRIAALALLSWAFMTGAVWLAWRLFH
jgi:hypothetical protein